MSESPYAPPKAKVAETLPGLPLSTPLASGWARFGNYFLDWFFGWIFSWLLAVLAAMVLGALGNTTWNHNPWLNQLIGMALFTVYYLVFEGVFGWTPAKLITGTRVVDEAGCKPVFPKILGRSLARSVPLEPFSFLGATGIGWHDRWSGTRVVSIRRQSGPTLAESFQPDFRREKPSAQETAAAGPRWTPSDGPPAWCPNCGTQIPATVPKCGCGADFTSAEGWKPLAERPSSAA